MDAVINNDSIAIERHGKNAIVMNGQSAFTFEVSSAVDPRDASNFNNRRDTLNWDQTHYNVNGWRILPYGDNNDLPIEIKEAVQHNPFLPGMIEKSVGLLWGKGPFIYKELIDPKNSQNKIREVVVDPEVEAWLKRWDYQDYLLSSIDTYIHMRGFFTKFHRNRAPRIGGQAKIAKLEHVGSEDCRLASEWERNSKKPTHVVETDFSFNGPDSLVNMNVYALFNPDSPFINKTSMFYSNKYSFGSKSYPVPPLYGSLGWIRRSTAIPLILEALSRNAINVTYHVKSPQSFWDDQEERIKANCEKRGVPYKDSMLEEYKILLLKGISKVLSDEANTGKFWHSTKSFDVMDNNLIEMGWEIEPIEQNIKDFVEAQILISDHSIKNVGANMGLHAANAGVSENGKSDSGSEQLYAHDNHKKVSTPIQEMIVMKPMNLALEANWPNKGYKMGFMHEQVQRQQDLTSSERHINKA